MTIEQIIEIPASRRITIDLPPEIPPGKGILMVPRSCRGGQQDIERINRNAERLNQEALDVLSYQGLLL
ncbi:MAG: hypothetical protein LBD55_07805 [Treponema sp.]|nr:hypothetical protein [Treponema sp.]